MRAPTPRLGAAERVFRRGVETGPRGPLVEAPEAVDKLIHRFRAGCDRDRALDARDLSAGQADDGEGCHQQQSREGKSPLEQLQVEGSCIDLGYMGAERAGRRLELPDFQVPRRRRARVQDLPSDRSSPVPRAGAAGEKSRACLGHWTGRPFSRRCAGCDGSAGDTSEHGDEFLRGRRHVADLSLARICDASTPLMP